MRRVWILLFVLGAAAGCRSSAAQNEELLNTLASAYQACKAHEAKKDNTDCPQFRVIYRRTPELVGHSIEDATKCFPDLSEIHFANFPAGQRVFVAGFHGLFTSLVHIHVNQINRITIAYVDD